MKRIIKNKIYLILILSQFLTSCAITRAMWGGGDYDLKGDTISSFFIDKEQNRIVLIGDEKDEKGNDHYSAIDHIGNATKTYEIAQKSAINGGYVAVGFEKMKSKGNKIIGGFYGIGIGTKGLSLDDIKFLKAQGFKLSSDSVRLTAMFAIPEMDRYPSTQEQLKNLCSYEPAKYITIDKGQPRSRENIIPKEPVVKLVAQPKLKSSNNPDCIPVTLFDQPWKGIIQDQYTVGQKIGRIAATPFTIVADIILTPLYLIGIIGMGAGSK